MSQDQPRPAPQIITTQPAEIPSLAAAQLQAYRQPGQPVQLYRLTLALRTSRLADQPGRAIMLDLPVHLPAAQLAEALRQAAAGVQSLADAETALGQPNAKETAPQPIPAATGSTIAI